MESCAFIFGMKNALDEAKRRCRGASGLAPALGGISPQAVSQWKRVPSERVLDVERVTGISRSELRPDLYPLDCDASSHPPCPEAAE
jgi:DNA-binding transcriptional regulator YdaS (Cro superfamily)